jgi:predicted ATPase
MRPGAAGYAGAVRRARRREQVLGRATGGFISAMRLAEPECGSEEPPRSGYPWELPSVKALTNPGGLALHPGITYLVGENGSGKSTLMEGLAVAAGMNPEGGSSNFAFDTRASHSPLGAALSLVRTGRSRRTDFFLRAESLFTAATYLEGLTSGLDGEAGALAGNALGAYGGVSLHEQSHGESFLAVLLQRFGPDGLYLLDEPEAALSTQNQFTCLRRIDELVGEGSQFVIATHSPLLLAHPRARIYELSADAPPAEIAWEDAEPVRLTRRFLEDPERFLGALLSD